METAINNSLIDQNQATTDTALHQDQHGPYEFQKVQINFTS